MAETRTEHWLEWRRRCALPRCSPPAQDALRDFAHHRFALYLSRYARETCLTSAAPPALPPQDAWHLFESHLALKSTREGKRYKEWLVARTAGQDAQEDARTLESGSTLIIRAAAREFLHREFSPRGVLSMQQNLAEGSGGSVTLEDLLAGGDDPAAEAARREYERLADQHAAEEFPDLERRERVAVAAKALGLSLAHPTVERLAGCRRSVLNTSYQAWVERLAARLRLRYVDDDQESVLHLVMQTIQNVKNLALRWAKSENACARLFMEIEA